MQYPDTLHPDFHPMYSLDEYVRRCGEYPSDPAVEHWQACVEWWNRAKKLLPLSTDNISPQAEGDIIPAKLTYRKTGHLASVTRQLIIKKCRCGELYKVEEYRKDDRGTCCWFCSHPNRGKRGKIQGFSYSSKRNLMRSINSVDTTSLSKMLFGTGTVPDSFYRHENMFREAKRVLDVFGKVFMRAYPDALFYWRMEIEERKSGKYIGKSFPHFHFLFLGVSYRQFSEFFAEKWPDLVASGQPDYEDCKWVHSVERGKAVTRCGSRRAVLAYASKALGHIMSAEVAKDLQTKGDYVGRWWGIIGRKNLPMYLSELVSMDVVDEQVVEFMRYFRKAIKCLPSMSLRSLTVFVSALFIEKILDYKSDFGCYQSGRRLDKPFFLHAYQLGKITLEQFAKLSAQFSMSMDKWCEAI